MLSLEIVENPQAAVALDPVRSRLLSKLVEPASAAGGFPHQLLVLAHPLPHENPEETS